MSSAAAAIVAAAMLAAHRVLLPSDVLRSLGRGLLRRCSAGRDARRAPCPLVQHRGGHRRRRVLGAGAAARPPNAVQVTGWRSSPGSPGASTASARRWRSRGWRRRAAGAARHRPAARDWHARRGGVRSGDVRGPRLPRRRSGARAAGRLRPPLRSPRVPAAGAGGARQHLLRGSSRRADRRRRHEVGHLHAAPRPGRSKRRCAPRRRRRRARCTSASTSCRSPASTRATSAWAFRCRARGRCAITGSPVRPTAPTARSSSCMSDVVSTWFFEPLPASMRVILPVQVLRTDKPLPYGQARAAADLQRTTARAEGREQRQSSRRAAPAPNGPHHPGRARRAAAGDRAHRGRLRVPGRLLALGDRAQR